MHDPRASSRPVVRVATVDDLPGFHASLRAQLADNGRDGVWFSTLLLKDAPERFTPERLEEARQAFVKPLTEPSWLRVFVVELDGLIVGHADLKGNAHPATMHRCTLGLGLVRAVQGRGLGTALMNLTIDWAREAGLRWMDLGVMGGNDRALALYRKLGFVEVGRVPDRFRVGETALTDIIMTLALTR